MDDSLNTTVTVEDGASSSTATTAPTSGSNKLPQNEYNNDAKPFAKTDINSNPNTNNISNSNSNTSVISDLMRVYERLTQSSTPQSSSISNKNVSTTEITNNHNCNTNTSTAMIGGEVGGVSMTDISSVFGNLMKSTSALTTMTNNSNNNISVNHHSYGIGNHKHNNPSYHPATTATSTSKLPVPQFSDPPITASKSTTAGNGNFLHAAQLNSNIWGIAASAASVTSSMHSCGSAASDVTENTHGGGEGSGRRKRKSRSSGGSMNGSQYYGRKKSDESDNRWSKRFAWPEESHRDFVAAVFDVGLKQSSPAALLEFMPPNDDITSERVKSHLQKYRIHKAKSKQEFMASYDASLARLNQEHNNHTNDTTSSCSTMPWRISNADGAAWLTYVTLKEDQYPEGAPNSNSLATGAGMSSPSSMLLSNVPRGSNNENTSKMENYNASSPTGQMNTENKLAWPELTEEEKKSPLGISMSCLFGLYISLHAQLLQQRQLHQQQQHHHNAPFISSIQSVPSLASNYDKSNPSNESNNSVISSNKQLQYHNHQQVPSPFNVPEVTAAGSKRSVDNGKQQLTSFIGGQPQHDDVPQSVVLSNTTGSTDDATSVMKREMQSQMALQNKMRIIMQQEMNKYSSDLHVTSNEKSIQQHGITMNASNISNAMAKDSSEVSNPSGILLGNNNSEEVVYLHSNSEQGDKEDGNTEKMNDEDEFDDNEASTRTRPRAHSLSGHDIDFWDTEVPDDDAVFRFLLS